MNHILQLVATCIDLCTPFETLLCFTMKTSTLGLLFHLLSCSTVVVHSQTGSCSSCNCQVNNVESLRSLVQSLVNQSLNDRLPNAVNQAVNNRWQDVQQQVNASIDEKVINSQREIPGELALLKILSTSVSVLLTNNTAMLLMQI